MANAEIVELYPSVENQVSPEEWQARIDLAACYRLVALYDMSDMTRTHISAKVPGEETFLLNPYGLMFDEITASSLIKIDIDGNEIDNTGPYRINAAGFTIHGAVHGARPGSRDPGSDGCGETADALGGDRGRGAGDAAHPVRPLRTRGELRGGGGADPNGHLRALRHRRRVGAPGLARGRKTVAHDAGQAERPHYDQPVAPA